MNLLLSKLRAFINNDLLYEIVIFILIIIAGFIFSKVVSFLLCKVLKPIAKRTNTTFDDKIVDILQSSSKKVVIFASFYLALGVFKNGINLASLSTKRTLISEHPYLSEIVNAAEYLLFIFLVYIFLMISFKIVKVMFEWYAEKINAEENKNLSGSLFPLLNKVAKVILSMLAIAIILAKFKIDISGFVVSLGVGSLALALAAQETISNMISGFIIMTDRPFRIGDRIKIGNDIFGDVVEIGIRSTKILDFDNNILNVPNNDIAKARIVNLSYPNTGTRVLINVNVAYGSDLDKVKQILFRCADENELVDKTVPYDFGFMNFGDYSLQLRLGVRAKEYKSAYDISNQLREAIYNNFNKAGIEIPLPQRVVFQKNLENEKTKKEE